MGETKINISVAYISDENTSLAGMFVFTYLFIRTSLEGPKPKAPEANIKITGDQTLGRDSCADFIWKFILICQSLTSTPISLASSVYSGNFNETFNEIFRFAVSLIGRQLMTGRLRFKLKSYGAKKYK